MSVGYLYTLVALASFGMLGILNKVAEVKKCRPSAVSASLCMWSGVMVCAYLVFYKHSSVSAPRQVIVVAILFGISAAIASIAFLAGLKYGKILQAGSSSTCPPPFRPSHRSWFTASVRLCGKEQAWL